MNLADLERYERWYLDDVIPGFQRQAAARQGDNMYYDAVWRSEGHLARIQKEIAVKKAEFGALEEGGGSDIPEAA